MALEENNFKEIKKPQRNLSRREIPRRRNRQSTESETGNVAEMKKKWEIENR